MSEQQKKITLLQPGDEGYRKTDEEGPSRKLGLRRADQKLARVTQPEVPSSYMSYWEVRRLWKDYMLNCLEQEMHAHLAARGFELTVMASEHMLKIYDEALGRVFDLYYNQERDEGHAAAVFEACELTIDILTQQLGVSLKEVNQKLAQIAMRTLRTGGPPGFWDRLLGG